MYHFFQTEKMHFGQIYQKLNLKFTKLHILCESNRQYIGEISRPLRIGERKGCSKRKGFGILKTARQNSFISFRKMRIKKELIRNYLKREREPRLVFVKFNSTNNY